MSQSCFSLGFLSQNSLWKLSTFHGYKGYLYWSEKGMRRVSFSITEWTGNLASRLDWVASPSREITEWSDWSFLSCSATTGMTVQLLCMLHSCASSCGLQAASHLRDPAASPCFTAQFWAFLHTLSHTLPLHDSHLNIRLLIAKLQANLVRNKANKMVD